MQRKQLLDTYKKLFWSSWIVFGLFAVISFSSQRMLFFNGGNDFGADYFNTNRYVAEFDPYGNTINGACNHNYLPINYVFQYILSLTADYGQMTLSDCWHDLWGCLLPFALYSIICVGFFLYSLIKVAQRFKINKRWIFIPMLSSIMLYTIERGNTILIAATFVNLFIAYFDNPNKGWRRIAVIALSIASVMKMVPGILCVLYLKKKDYKGLLFYGIISSLLTILPFLCFPGGVHDIFVVKNNMAAQISTYSAMFSPYRFGLMGIATEISIVFHTNFWSIFAKLLSYILLFASIYIAYVIKDNNKAIIYLLFIPALWSGSVFAYNAIYLFPLFLYTVGGYWNLRKTIISLSLFFFIFQPVQIVWHGITLSYIFANLCSVGLWFYFVFEGFSAIFKMQISDVSLNAKQPKSL